MYKTRLGLISESSYPTQNSLLPYDAIEVAFRDVDGILYSGDSLSPEILEFLSGIAPTQAVSNDPVSCASPEKRVLTFGDVRVGLTYGNRHPLIERYFALQRQLGNIYAGGRHLLDTLPARFAEDNVNVIVFGHLNIPLNIHRKGILLVNPGAVRTISSATAQWELLREVNPKRRQRLEAYIRTQRNQSQHALSRSTVGILEIHDNKTVTSKIQSLPLLSFA